MLPGSSEWREQVILFKMANGLNFPTFMKFLLITILQSNSTGRSVYLSTLTMTV